jgi:energy-coupling factor transporter transmembrane protein EcfT
MRNLIKFILFLIYSVGIFFIEDYIILALILIFNISLMIIAKISLKNALNNTIKLLPFILFTIVINIIFMDLKSSILIGIRLILIRNLTYIFSKNISYMEFAGVIEKMVYPLKIFGINPEEIGLIVIIALSFIPIIKNEFEQIRNVLKVKGIKPTTFNMLKNLGLIFKPFLISVMQRINEIEMSLKAKGYQE